MSTLSNLLSDSLSLLYPAQCIACGALIESRIESICINCRADIPLTYFHHESENPMAVKIKALHPSVENIAAQFYYINNGRWREVIHKIKYKNSWLSAQKLGYIYGTELLESPLFQDIDLVVPIPLHPKRLMKRRYNQSEKIASGIAQAMGVKMNTKSLQRSRYNSSQTTRSKTERWANVKGIFSVSHPQLIAGQHILLVDDVFTTGATISAALEAIESAAPTCRVSIATLAVSRFAISGNIN